MATCLSAAADQSCYIFPSIVKVFPVANIKSSLLRTMLLTYILLDKVYVCVCVYTKLRATKVCVYIYIYIYISVPPVFTMFETSSAVGL